VQGLDGTEPEAGRRALAELIELQAGTATADTARLSARERAIDGLRAIAQFEEYVAASIDEPGYYGRMAGALRSSARRRRCAASRLDGAEAGRAVLRTV
jgi:3-hydroxy-3-methylglutaryl CoA synthase